MVWSARGTPVDAVFEDDSAALTTPEAAKAQPQVERLPPVRHQGD